MNEESSRACPEERQMTANNIKEWIRKAEEDLISAEVLLEASIDRIKFLTSTIGFHSQQCIEKSLKGYLIKNQKEFRKTHDMILPQKGCKI